MNIEAYLIVHLWKYDWVKPGKKMRQTFFRDLEADIYNASKAGERKLTDFQLTFTCSKSTVETPERRQWRQWIYFTPFSSVSIVEFEQVNVSWVDCYPEQFYFIWKKKWMMKKDQVRCKVKAV